ncbi:MAG: EVE domain-containing protein [Candidatus Thermochlorobacter sp.]
MAYFLLKTEPTEYSLEMLQTDGETVWNGVKNALALQHLRKVKTGDMCFIYHTGKEKQIVGLGEATSDVYTDSDGADVFKIKFKEKFVTPLSLAEMKKDKHFENFELLRLPRLSVMPVAPALAEYILKKVR